MHTALVFVVFMAILAFLRWAINKFSDPIERLWYLKRNPLPVKEDYSQIEMVEGEPSNRRGFVISNELKSVIEKFGKDAIHPPPT